MNCSKMDILKLFLMMFFPLLSHTYDLVCTDVHGYPLSTPAFGIPNNCNGYYKCYGGFLSVIPCVTGTAFDSSRGSCVTTRNNPDCALKTATVCEGRSSIVSCPSGSVIVMKYGYYGRQESNVCGRNGNTNCISSSSLENLMDKCNHKRSCSLEANNGVFGDPCRGVAKYIRMEYYCKKSEKTERSMKRTICEGESKTLRCPDGQIMTVKNGFYGRFNPLICPNSIMKTTSCYGSRSLGEMRRACNDKQTCTISASNSRFGDPCRGTWKYVELIYSCKSSSRNTVDVCEGSRRSISCKRGQVIQIIKGFYGRTEDKQTSCYSSNVRGNLCVNNTKKKLSRACNGRQSCELNASNSVYGDPCFGQLKYLQVTYECRRG